VRSFARRADGRRSYRADRLNALTDELSRHGGQLIKLFVRNACHDLSVFSGTGLSKPLPECRYSINDKRGLSRMQKSDAPFSRLLRDCFERQCRGGAAHKHQELAPQHVTPGERALPTL
jgi:hypothetical protein